MGKRIGITLEIRGGAQSFASAINFWTNIWQEPFGIRTLTLTKPVGLLAISVYGTRRPVIMQDYEGDCYLINWPAKGQARIKGWIRGSVFPRLLNDFASSLFWRDLKSDPLFT